MVPVEEERRFRMNGKLFAAFMALAGLLFCSQLGADDRDVAGSRDPSLFTRMPGWYIVKYEENEFSSSTFTDAKKAKVAVEGHKIFVAYAWAGDGKKPSSLQVIRNYGNAIKKAGGTVLFTRNDDYATLKLVKDGRETWVELESEVDAGWGGFGLTIVEKDVMVQEVTANAASMGSDIKATGHVAVYGINFDGDKAELRPEAGAVIAEIAKLLKQDPGLRVFVVGHTANVGDVQAGLSLSQARAAAVAKALTDAYGISADRMSTFGAGPYCPVSTNLTEEGRAKNRRVELVQQ
jgi:OmpA-OmpF porin, OOP family